MNRKMNEAQVKHYLLSYNDSTLIYWYNNVIISPWQEFSEQGIRDNNEDGTGDLLTELSLEALVNASRNKNTRYSEADKYFALTGGTDAYLVSFDTFAEFLETESGKSLVKWLVGTPEDLESLEEIGNRAENL